MDSWCSGLSPNSNIQPPSFPRSGWNFPTDVPITMACMLPEEPLTTQIGYCCCPHPLHWRQQHLFALLWNNTGPPMARPRILGSVATAQVPPNRSGPLQPFRGTGPRRTCDFPPPPRLGNTHEVSYHPTLISSKRILSFNCTSPTETTILQVPSRTQKNAYMSMKYATP